MDSAPRRGGSTWTQILRTEAAGTLACDFLTVETIGLTRLYLLFVIELQQRGADLTGVGALQPCCGSKRTVKTFDRQSLERLSYQTARSNWSWSRASCGCWLIAVGSSATGS